MQVAELAGMIDVIINGIPFNKAPIPVYHSHNVDIVDAENGKDKVLRVAFFSKLDPEAMFSEVMMGGSGMSGTKQTNSGIRLRDLLKGRMSLKAPFALKELRDSRFRFNSSTMQGKFHANFDVDRGSSAQELVDKLPDNMKYTMNARLAIAKFLGGLDFTLNFSDIDSLVNNYNPNMDSQISLSKKKNIFFFWTTGYWRT